MASILMAMNPEKVRGILEGVGTATTAALSFAALKTLVAWCDKEGGHMDVSYDAHTTPAGWTVTLWAPLRKNRSPMEPAPVMLGNLECILTATEPQLSSVLGRMVRALRLSVLGIPAH